MRQTRPSIPGYDFPKIMHLRKRGEFDNVFGQRRSHADRVLIVYGATNARNVSRLGLVVSKKVGKANLRNRWKRLIREVFRLEQHKLSVPVDLVVIPRQGIVPDFYSVRRSFQYLSARLIKNLTMSQELTDEVNSKDSI